MDKKLIPLLIMVVIATSCSQKMPDGVILVKGGTFVNTKSKHGKGVILQDFYMGRHEVTQKEWVEVMGSNPSQFKGESLPVETVNWYDCIEYCNKRSVKEGLKPYYQIDRDRQDPENTNTIDDIKLPVTVNNDANGYRLPTETEWEYAAGGGRQSKSYTYSGSNTVDEVAWYWKNSGDKYLADNWSWPALEKNHNKTKPVGSKKANELGLYDMAGNVREWCWDWHRSNANEDQPGRIWKGGGWMGADFCCEPSFSASYQANGKGPDQGLRVCRGK